MLKKIYLPIILIAVIFIFISNVTAVNATNVTVDQISNASGNLQTYIETNHAIPTSINVSGNQVTNTQFLKLQSQALLNINTSANTSIPIGTYGNAGNPQEYLATSMNINQTEYLSMASRTNNFMNTNGVLPNYVSITSAPGNYVRPETLTYIFSQILNSYKNTGILPDFVTVNKWTVISNTNTVFFSIDQINNASTAVKSYVETNHGLPSYVTISSKQVTMAQFLKLETLAVLNINGNLNSKIVYINFGSATNPLENITTSININITDYVDLANRVNTFMNTNVVAPNYGTINTPQYTYSPTSRIRFETLVYTYAQILNSYKITGIQPDFIIINQWSVVSNASTVFISIDDINNASSTIKTYIETNHQLPANVDISSSQINMAQFLKLATMSILNIKGNAYVPIPLGYYTNPTYPQENATDGLICDLDYIEIANRIIPYMNTYKVAPNYANLKNATGDMNVTGRYMRFESLVYMYAQVLDLYNSSKILPEKVSFTPWIAVSNPGKVYNFRSREFFDTIQAAINDTDTLNGDIITLGNKTFSENVIVNKSLILRPLYDYVTVQAENHNLPVFIINNAGSGSEIQYLIIKGFGNSTGIYVNNSNNNTISNNNITTNKNGIIIENSNNNLINYNTITNNTENGLYLLNGNNHSLSDNNISNNNLNGILVNSISQSQITRNIISSNSYDGISIYNSSPTVNFNSITGNSRYGLYNEGNGTVDATNNWWGSNNPLISLNGPSDIAGNNINSTTWLVMNVTSSCDRSNRTGSCYNYIITADITHNNQGNDTSKNNNIPNGIPIFFNTNLGTINTSTSTSRGKAVLLLTNTSAGLANVTAVLNNQTINLSVNLTSVDVLGVYNNRTNQWFNTIQDAINDTNTLDGDTITLHEGTYTENIIISKKITLKPFTGENVIIQAPEPDGDLSVIIITSEGSGSTIQNLNVNGNGDSCGIDLNSATNCQINGNTIKNNNCGISFSMSNNNTISGNNFKNNFYGITIYSSINTTITSNTITNSFYGIYLYNSTDNGISGNIVGQNWVGIYLHLTNNTNILENNITDNGCGICCYDSNNNSINANNFTNNWVIDKSSLNSSEIILATTVYTCGPAALATVLKHMGLNVTEEELINLAGTDETGTSINGLVQAAQNKGLTASGYKLNIDQLRNDFIIVLNIGGNYHYNIFKNITNNTVYLMDPNIGCIEMNLTKFGELYIGYALVVFNGTIEINGTLLTYQEMQIKATWFRVFIRNWGRIFDYINVGSSPERSYYYTKGWALGWHLHEGWCTVYGYHSHSYYVRGRKYTYSHKGYYSVYKKYYAFGWYWGTVKRYYNGYQF